MEPIAETHSHCIGAPAMPQFSVTINPTGSIANWMKKLILTVLKIELRPLEASFFSFSIPHK